MQSTEGVPAFVHGGPFANIAHGCNSVLATRMAMAPRATTPITEAGFAFDLGGEKFFDIKCRSAGLEPGGRGDRRHRPRPEDARRRPLSTTSPSPTRRPSSAGWRTWPRHLDAAAHFGKPIVVAINQRRGGHRRRAGASSTPSARPRNVPCATADVFGKGGAGATELAEQVVAAAAAPETPYQPLYPLDWPAEQKIEAIARSMYGADGVAILPDAEAKLRKAEPARLRRACRSAWPRRRTRSPTTPSSAAGRRGSRITVRDVEIAAGAGFLVALTGEIVRMPGLPQRPAAERIDVDAEGNITGLS